jgi:hypothetical protein
MINRNFSPFQSPLVVLSPARISLSGRDHDVQLLLSAALVAHDMGDVVVVIRCMDLYAALAIYYARSNQDVHGALHPLSSTPSASL